MKEAWQVGAMVVIGAAVAAPAFAAPASFVASESADGASLTVRFATEEQSERPALSATVADGVLTLTFTAPVEGDVSALAGGAPGTVALARRDAEGRTVRVALRRAMNAAVSQTESGYVIALTPRSAAPPPPPPTLEAPLPPPPPPVSVDLTVSQRGDRTRLTFRWPTPATLVPRVNGDRVELRFSRPGTVDLSQVRATPPPGLVSARTIANSASGLRLGLQLEPGVTVRHFVDGDRVVVDLIPAPAAASATEGQMGASTTAAAPEAAPPPPSFGPRGSVPTSLVEAADATRISVRWPGAVKAAAFRRGDSVWVLFDGTTPLDLSRVMVGGRRHRELTAVRGEGTVGLRLRATGDQQLSMQRDGEAWVLSLSASRPQLPDPAPVSRMRGADGRPLLAAEFASEGVVRWISDPEVGDRLAVALIDGPARGVVQRMAALEANLLPAALGAVVEPRADGIGARFDGNRLVVGAGVDQSAGALTADPVAADPAVDPALLAEDAAPTLGVNAGAANLEIRRQLQALERRAAAEGVGQGRRTEARLGLARFMLERELAAEALGALRLAALNDQGLQLDPEYRLMRAAANVMMGRTDDATADLALGALADNPSAALWRGIALADAQRWAEARAELERGQAAVDGLPPSWRTRFHLALAETALNLNDIVVADQASMAAASAASPEQRGLAALLTARILAARGDGAGALVAFDALAKSRSEPVAVRASLEAVRTRRLLGQITPEAAAEVLDGLRFRWRGDELELQAVATLADAYVEMNRYREALLVMQTAANHAPRLPGSRRLRLEMTTVFQQLFLEGGADKLEPIRALGLFYEFQHLTPVGPDGDRMVRLLAGRLVAVDLLEQAATLLQHQVDERLDGMARAQVAGELALIYLQDRKPDKALIVLGATRIANLPPEIVAERRLLEATALLELGRFEHAVELLERDRSPDAQRLRADAAWRQGDWARASREIATLLTMRPPGQPPTAEERQVILRAAIAATLGGDESTVRALYRLYAPGFADTPEAPAFELVAGDGVADVAAVRDLARSVSRTDLIDRFLEQLKARMTAEAPPAPEAPPVPAPGGPTPAPPPPQASAVPADRRQGQGEAAAGA